MRATLMLLIILLPLPVLAGQAPTDAVLAELKAKAGTIQSIESRFTQEKHLEMFDEILISTGCFAFRRPASLRWEYDTPFRTGFLLHGSSGIEWDEASGEQRDFTLETSPAMAMVARQIIAWTTFDIPWLRKRYAITLASNAPLTLVLRPLSTKAKEFISHIQVVFTPDKATIDTLDLVEPGGDYTHISFDAPQINAPLPDTAFTTVR